MAARAHLTGTTFVHRRRSTATATILLACTTLGGCTVWQAGNVYPDTQNAQVHRGSETLAFDPGSTVLATGGWDGEVALWRPGGAAPEHVWEAHSGSVQGVGYAGPTLVTAGYDGLLRAWDPSGRLLYEADTGAPIRRLGVMSGRVVTGHVDGAAQVRTLPGFALERRLELHASEVAAVAVHEPSGSFATSGYDGRVFLVSAGGAARLAAPASDVLSLSFDEQGETLYGGGWREVYRWRVAGDGVTRIPTAHWGYIADVQHLAASNTLASISRVNDSSVLFLDADTGASVRHFSRQSICGSVARVSPNGSYLATTGDDGAIRVWDLRKALAADGA